MSESPAQPKPVATYVLIALCVWATIRLYRMLFTLVMTSQGKPDFLAFFHSNGIGFVPIRGMLDPFPWVTSLFYHSGFSHLFWNMLALWFFGRSAERGLSRSEYLELFFASGLIGTFLVFLFTPKSIAPHMGASGAINGLMAFYFLGAAGKAGGGFWNAVKAYWLCGAAMAVFIFPDMILAAAQSRGAEVGNVAYLAHAGGALGGWLFNYIKGSPEPAQVLVHPRRTVPVARPAPAQRRVGRTR